MPKDAFTIYRAQCELDALRGGHIDKITMPDQNTLVLQIRSDRKNYRLLISCAPDLPRCHLTSETFENPPVAYGFLMHLRKHIGGGVVESIACPKSERIVELKINALDELKNPTHKTLIAEMTGNHSDIILVNENGIISDAARRVTDVTAKRMIAPNVEYVLPDSNGRFDIFDERFIDGALSLDSPSLDIAIKKNTAGFAPVTIDEIFARYNIDKNAKVTRDNVAQFVESAKAFYEIASAPVVSGGAKPDFFAFPYVCAGEDLTSYETLNAAMDAFYSELQRKVTHKQAGKALLQALTRAENKARKRLSEFIAMRDASSDRENDRIKGELLTANIYRIHQGDTCVELENYYDGSTVKIKLDPMLSPSKNAAKYFKSYAKKKRAASVTETMIAETEKLLDGIEAIKDSYRLCETRAEFLEAENELAQLVSVKKQTAKKKMQKTAPMQFRVNGFDYFVGKNNAQNDRLTRGAKSDDIWFHAQKIHGSHGVLRTDGKTPDDSVLSICAAIAAFYSRAFDADKVAVDYTLAKNVRFPSGAALGFVNYKSQKTLFVKPDNGEKFSVRHGN